ncbi:MAG: family transcriptional regulator [Pseudobdellovibrio sp.]|jgi:transcriptional regulator with XRE-family HTH domain|nr:family transcriptional regulator [Pseudobdellovibrio sp.]
MEKQVMDLVKKKAQAMGITQKQMAKELKVSIPTVKRWWAGKGLTLPVLQQVSHLLGLQLSELFHEAESRGSGRYTYTLEQERVLIQNPQALALFDLLVSGKSVAAIKRKYPLKDSVLTGLLLKLDKAGLIELGAENKVKLVKAGEPQWIPGGPLSLKYRRQMIENFLADHPKSETVFLIQDYSPEDAALIEARLKDLEKLMHVCNARSGSATSATSYGVYLTFKKFEWDLRDTLNR